MATIVQIQLRRDTAADWTTNDPTLAEGEVGYETDTTRIKIGDGSTAWTSLAYWNEGDKTYVHVQGGASASWAVAHNLGKFPSPVVVDSGGNEIEGEINHTDNNNLTITFSTAFTGSAYIN